MLFRSGNYGSSNLSIYLNNGVGMMIAQPPIAAGMNPRAMAAANPNKDDYDDVFVANWGGASVGVFIGDGIGYPNPASVGSGTNPSSVAMAFPSSSKPFITKISVFARFAFAFA